MSKILLGVAAMAAATFIAPSAYAGVGGWTPPWASAWYNPNGPSTTVEGRSVFTGDHGVSGDYGNVQPRGDVVHERHRSHRHAAPQR